VKRALGKRFPATAAAATAFNLILPTPDFGLIHWEGQHFGRFLQLEGRRFGRFPVNLGVEVQHDDDYSCKQLYIGLLWSHAFLWSLV
jgi:hypothetical protein